MNGELTTSDMYISEAAEYMYLQGISNRFRPERCMISFSKYTNVIKDPIEKWRHRIEDRYNSKTVVGGF